MTDSPSPPAIGSTVVLRGRVHAVTPGGMLCVETSAGGFVWLMPAEVEGEEQQQREEARCRRVTASAEVVARGPLPAREVTHGTGSYTSESDAHESQ